MVPCSPACPPRAPALGDIVWAKDRAAHCWWPCEKLDPLHMPAGEGGALLVRLWG